MEQWQELRRQEREGQEGREGFGKSYGKGKSKGYGGYGSYGESSFGKGKQWRGYLEYPSDGYFVSDEQKKLSRHFGSDAFMTKESPPRLTPLSFDLLADDSDGFPCQSRQVQDRERQEGSVRGR